MLNIIVNKIRTKQELENQYGWQSCFDVPEAYKQMDQLAEEIIELCGEIAKHESDEKGFLKFLPAELLKVLKTVSDEIDELEDLEISVLTQDEYIEQYVLEGMSDDARTMFDNLFYYMNSDDRAAWLNSHYIDNDCNAYADKYADFVVMVSE